MASDQEANIPRPPLASIEGVGTSMVLRLPVKHAQHPVVAGKIGEIPRHGSVRLPQRVSAIDQGDIVKLGTSNAFGLHDSEQAGIMQVALGLWRQAAKFFRL